MKVKKLRGCLSFEQKCDKVTIASHLWITGESEKSFRTEGAKAISISALEIVLNNMLQTSFVREYPSRGPCIGRVWSSCTTASYCSTQALTT